VLTTTVERRPPTRTCVGCRRRAPQTELVRCVLDGVGSARISRTAPGRGAWLCGPACLDPAIRRGGFERAWRTSVPASAISALAAHFGGPGDDRSFGANHPDMKDLQTRVKG
jgi:predicted RNA-binding protein YlxR (DUF448 family)